MNNLPRNNWQHAATSAVIMALFLLLLYVLLISPAISRRQSFYDRYEEQQFQYARLAGIVLQADQVRKELVQLQDSGTDTSGFLEEKAPALAAADLQNYIQGLIESHNGNLISTQVLQQQGTETFPEVTVKVHMRCNIASLQNILFSLEAGQLFLMMDNLFLQAHNQAAIRNNRRRPAVQQPSTIEARFDITGYIFQTNSDET
jgi:hypothetical protein